MDTDGIVKQYAKEIMWGIHLLVMAFVGWGGAIFGYKINKLVIVGVMLVSLYIFTKLHNALILEINKPPRVVYREQKKEPMPEKLLMEV